MFPSAIQLIQWAFLAARYFSARWISSFSGSSGMLWGHWRVFQPFLLGYTTYKPWCPILLACLLTFAFHKFSYQYLSPSHLWNLTVSHGAIRNSHQLPTLVLSQVQDLLVPGSFPWSVQEDSTEARPCHCLHALTGLQALVRHPE